MENPEQMATSVGVDEVLRPFDLYNQDVSGMSGKSGCQSAQFTGSLPKQLATQIIGPDPKMSYRVRHLIDRKLNSHQRAAFENKFGDILMLPEVEINPSLIRAMVHFWDIDRRCFTFPEYDLVPIVEEFGAMMKLPKLMRDNLPYAPVRNAKAVKPMAFFLDMNMNSASKLFVEYLNPHPQKRPRGPDVREAKRQKVQNPNKREPVGVSLDEILKFLEYAPSDFARTSRFLDTLALVLFAMYIFPAHPSYVDSEVIKFVYMVARFNYNPIPGILSETLHSLDYCRTNRKGKMQCAVPLMHVWAVSHLFDKHFKNAWYSANSPLSEIRGFHLSYHTADQWIKALIEDNESPRHWKAPWMDYPMIVVSVRGFPWVTLVGPWNGVAYAPTLGMRQFGLEQGVCNLNGLKSWTFSPGSEDRWRLVSESEQAWKEVKVTETHRNEIGVRPGFELWRKAVLQSFTFPVVTKGSAPTQMEAKSSKSGNFGEEIWASQEQWVKKLQVDMGQMEECNEKLTQEVNDLKVQLCKVKSERKKDEARMAEKDGMIKYLQERSEELMKLIRTQAKEIRNVEEVERLTQRISVLEEGHERQMQEMKMRMCNMVPRDDWRHEREKAQRLISEMAEMNYSMIRLRQEKEESEEYYLDHLHQLTQDFNELLRKSQKMATDGDTFLNLLEMIYINFYEAIRPEYISAPQVQSVMRLARYIRDSVADLHTRQARSL